MSDAGRDAGAINEAGRGRGGLPQDFPFQILTWEQFNGLNTKSPRPAIADSECSWMDGFMPIGPSNARTLYGIGAAAYTAPANRTIVWFNFGNIGDTSYGVVLLDNGQVQVFNTTTLQVSNVLPAGTIISPSSVFGFSQWGSQYLIFAKDQENGYWLWDGLNVFASGTLGPQVTLANAGSNYTSPPTVGLQTTGSGTGVQFSTTIDNGSVTKITVTNPGSGFGVTDFVNVYIQGGGSDNQAVAQVVVSDTTGGIDQIIVVQGGSGYTAATKIEVTSGAFSDAPSFSPSISNGVITAVALLNPGDGFTGPVTIVANDPGYSGQHIPGGTGAVFSVVVAYGQVTQVNGIDAGTGYLAPPTVTILGDGTGAIVEATVQSGQVSGYIVKNRGKGYSKALAVLTGGNNAANATPAMMPFGVSGTAVEVYSARVWVSNGGAAADTPPKNRTIYSDPNSPVTFAEAGGGVFQSTDSFLRVGYHWLKQTNGFLYLGGDSSINYISGVQTTASSSGASSIATTTFGNLNVDPQIGSPWPSSVQVFGRNIVFANTIGVYVSYGGAVTKASLPLDGFYYTGPIYGATANFSSAVAQLFGIPVYMLLLPIVNPFTGSQESILLMYDGKHWFSCRQDVTLTYIAGQEINSLLTAWGTTGSNIYQLFAKPSTGFTKTIQSKLFSSPGYYTTKTVRSLNVVFQPYTVDHSVTISVDNEQAIGANNAVLTVTPASSINVVNASNVIIPTVNASSATVIVSSGGGLVVEGPYPIGQSGRMIGLTVQTTASDLSLLSIALAEQAPFTANV